LHGIIPDLIGLAQPIESIKPLDGNPNHLFGGSGTTLIACHLHGRRARLMEYEPRYVDVICRRFQDATGVVPVRESTGEPHDFTSRS